LNNKNYFSGQVKNILQWLTNFIIFGNFFIAFCAVLMAYQTQILFNSHNNQYNLLSFIFFACISSYCLHWYLTKPDNNSNTRNNWNQNDKNLLFILFLVSSPFVFYFTFHLKKYFLWLFLVGLLTFLYTAPKLPHPLFKNLKNIAIGKTIFLSLVWTMVTVMLPLAVAEKKMNWAIVVFFTNRFFLIYSICILFDWRDREQDRLNGIKSLITLLNPEKIFKLFYLSLITFFVTCISLYWFDLNMKNIFFLIFPGVILLLLFKTSLNNNNDYFYYFLLDGLMAFSSLLIIINEFYKIHSLSFIFK